MALAAVGALVMSSGLVMLSASSATAGNDQPGNNGTVKVGDTGDLTDGTPENDPHLPCTFNIQWYNFDAGWGDITASVGFELQAPTDAKNGNTMSVASGDLSPVIVSNGGKPGAGDGYDALEWYTLSFTGAPQAQQGYHVKITVTTPHSQGADVKHKVFWVGPCAPSEREVPAAPVPTAPDCDTDGSLTLPADGDGLTWSIVRDGGAAAGASPYGPGVYDVTVTSAGLPFVGGGQSHTFQNITVLAMTGDCPARQLPAAPVPTAPDCDTDGSLTLPADGDGLTWSIVRDGGAAAGASPYGPGVYDVTVTSAGLPFVGGGQSHTFQNITVLAMTGDCVLGVEEIAPAVSFADPTCAKPNRATWSGNLTDLVDYAVSGTPGRGMSITVTASIKSDLADEFVFPEGYDNTFEHSYPTLTDLQCVKGSESVRPKPEKSPTVLGTQAVAPTAVDAGLSGTPAASPTTSLLAQLMVACGLLLLLAGGWIGLARGEHGAHQA
jgi:hypothetical protein